MFGYIIIIDKGYTVIEGYRDKKELNSYIEYLNKFCPKYTYIVKEIKTEEEWNKFYNIGE